MGKAVSAAGPPDAEPVDGSAGRRRLGWAVALLVVPLLLATLGLWWPGRDIERELTERSGAALRSAGYADATVSFDGRDAAVAGVPAGSERSVLEVVGGVDGVRVVRIADTLPAAVETVTVAVADDRIVLRATVPDEGTAEAVLAAARLRSGDRRIVDEFTVDPASALPGDAGRIGELVAALGHDPGERTVTWGSGGVALTGTTPSTEAGDAAEAAVRTAVGPAVPIDNELTVSGPPPVDKAAVQRAIDDLLGASIIGFEPDSTQLTPQGAAALGQLAGILLDAGGVPVEIGGHVAPAPGGPENAMRLSEARALVVRDALLAAGLPAGSLFPRGYGDQRPGPSQPASRRVEITVL